MGQINQAINVQKVIDFFGIENFIETGTGVGESLSYVLSIKNESLKVYTIELMDELYENLNIKFKDISNLELIKGYSHVEIANILNKISSNPTLFWHDAHFPGADFKINGATYTSEPDPIKRIPLYNELSAIKNSGRDTSKDVIVIDDLRIYEDGEYEDGNWTLRSEVGGDNIDFVYEMFDDTHLIIKSYLNQGYLILFPLSEDVDYTQFVVGA